MSPKLEEALREWLEKPAKKHGLCEHVFEFVYHTTNNWHQACRTVDELVDLFKADGLCELLPFHETLEEFETECDNVACDINPKRKAWVKSKLGVSNESTT